VTTYAGSMSWSARSPDRGYGRAVQRVAINGSSGSGKSTLARRLHDLLDLPYVEIDSLQHGPGWEPRPTFVDDVATFVDGERWVIEYQYDAVRPLILERADTFVWLDFSTRQVMSQVVRRTVRRRWRREELWHGNREGPLWRVLVDPGHVVRAAWRTRDWAAQRAGDSRRSHPELTVVRLRSRTEVEAWLTGLSGGGRPG
jgi:adenylate kinase family enzyme